MAPLEFAVDGGIDGPAGKGRAFRDGSNLFACCVDDAEFAAMLAGQDVLLQSFQARYAHPLIAPISPGPIGIQLLCRHRRHPSDDMRRDALVGIDAAVFFIPVDTGDGKGVVIVHADLGGDVGDGHFPLGGGAGVFAL
jgi:hypothetical protein